MQYFLKEVNEYPFLFSFIVRFIPISFGLQTFLLSISHFPIWKIIITSFFGLLIKTLPFIYVGNRGSYPYVIIIIIIIII